MASKYLYKKIIIILCIFMFWVGIMPIQVMAGAYDDSRKVIRVGCSLSTGYHMKDAEGEITGYGYSYEQIMSQYEGWDIEYVEGSWGELQQMLADGRIDMMGFLIQTDERKAKYDFSNKAAGTSMSCLITKENNDKFAYQDYEEFDGITVACQSNNANVDSFIEYANDNNFSVNMHYCDTYQDVYDAIDEGKVDAGLMTSFQDLDGYSIMDRLLPMDFYYAVSKGDEELLNELNDAMTRIRDSYTNFNDRLYQKYYDSNNGYDTMFTQDELDYIATNPVVAVVPGGRAQPFEYYNEDTGEFEGIVPDVLDRLSELTGIEFKYYKTNSRWEYNYSKLGNNIITSMSNDISWAKKNGMYITQPFVESSVSIISKGNIEDIKTVALVKTMYVDEIIKDKYPKWKIEYYDNKVRCIDAVKHDKCDSTIMNSYEADWLMSQGKYRSLNEITVTGIDQNICFGVDYHGDEELYGILSKAMLMISNTEYDEIFRKNVTNNGAGNIKNLIYTDPITVISVVASVTLLIILCILMIVYIVSIKRKNQEVVAANRAKSDFLSRMSHDIRTPMNTIINLTTIVKSELDDKELALADLDKIQSSNRFLLSIVNDVLDMSQIEDRKIELHPEVYSYKEFTDYINSTFVPMAEQKNISFMAEGIEDAPDIYIDKVRFNQVCFNLISNAIKYTQDGGIVTFRLDLGEARDGRMSCDMFVEDNGLGMSEEFQKQMFEPFAQEGRAYKTVEGTGLGLAIVKEIVELLDGTIQVLSKLNEGTQFHIHLDIELANENHNTKSNDNIDIGILEGKHVLLVEDHPLNQEIARKLLDRAGVSIEIASNGRIAVEEFSKNYSLYDAIIMDIRMPEMDGYEATRTIRSLSISEAQTIPIIAMTANAYSEDVEKCLAAGMDAHIAKPINPQELYGTLALHIQNNNHEEMNNVN